MGFGLLRCMILVAIVLHRKLCDATPVLTLTPGIYKFKSGDNLVLSCSVNELVNLSSVTFYQNTIQTIWMYNVTSCSFFNLIPNDQRNYSIICDPSNTKFTMIKYDLNVSDDKAVWYCQMISDSGGSCPISNNLCTSSNSTLILQGNTSDPNDKANCELEIGLGLGLGFGIQCVITGIAIGIFIYTSYKNAYFLGLVHGVGLGVTFQVRWIIIAGLISTGNKCKLELGLGLGLGTGMPCVITGIIAVIFMFSFFLCKGIPKRVEIGKGILTGLLFASVIGIIVVYFMYDKLKPGQTSTPKTVDIGKGILTGLLFASVIGIIVVYFMYDKFTSEQTSIEPEDKPREPADKKSKTNNSGNSSAVSREHVQVQMENKGFKRDEEERPPVVHTGTQNKVEPNTIISKQTNDRQRVPPADTGFEYRPQPPPPQNGEIKDRNLLRISVTIEDKLGLANETHRPNRLLPLPPNKATVGEEDASDEPKKKKKEEKEEKSKERDPRRTK